MNITLDYTALYDLVERSLSVIGKRATDEDGNRIFNDITLGTKEQDIVKDFLRLAVVNITTETALFVTGGNNDSVVLTIDSRWNEHLDFFLNQACQNYCIAYTLYSWFIVTSPRLSEKYEKDMNSQLTAIVRMSTEKKAPESTATSPLDITSEVN